MPSRVPWLIEWPGTSRFQAQTATASVAQPARLMATMRRAALSALAMPKSVMKQLPIATGKT